MEFTRDIILNLTPDASIPVVKTKQGDASVRFIRVTILKDHEQFIPGAEQIIVFREEKPDGTGVLLDNTYGDDELGRYLINVDADGAVVIELVEQTTTCPGLCKCDLCFYEQERTISTASFVLDVERAPEIMHQVVSSDDFRTLRNALDDVGRSSTTELSDMTDVALDGVVNGNVLVYDVHVHKWVNTTPSGWGFLTEPAARTIIEGYQYQTASQVNTLIANYINTLDANNVEY